MRAWALAVVLVVAAVGTAHAQRGLTPAEKDETRKAYEATRQAHLAIENLGEAERVAIGTTARTAIKDVWGGVEYLAREAGKGAFLLIGVNTATNDWPTLEAREALPRATWVADAFVHHDNVLANISYLTGFVDTALAVGSQAAAYYTRLNAVKTNWATMGTSLTSINRTLSYAQARNLPFCRDAATAQGSLYDTKRGACNVFGPHGNWILATNFFNLGWQEVVTAVLPTMRLVYTANDGAETAMPDSTNGGVADILVDLARLAENIMVVAFNFAVIPVTPTQCGFTPLRLVMRSIERVLQFGDTTNSATPPAEGGPLAGMPFFWAMRGNMAAVLDGFNAALATRPVTHALFNTTIDNRLSAWRQVEGGFWFALEMPSDLRNVIVGGTLGPPYAPVAGTTVFPYYFPVDRGSQLRVYVRDAGGTANRTPKVEGVDYTVNLAAQTVTMTVAPATDKHVEIERVGGTRLEESRRQPYPENDPAVGTVGPCS